MTHAVFTGDLIGSSKAEPQDIENAMKIIEECADEIANWQGSPTYFTRSRGDGWQIIVLPEHVLRTALFIVAKLRSSPNTIPTRFAVGFGDVLLRSNNLSDASGDALIAAGRGLDNLKSRQRILFENPPHSLCMIAPLIDFITQGWSMEQAEAMALALDPSNPTQSKIADKIGLRPQSLRDRLDGAGFFAFEEALLLSKTGL